MKNRILICLLIVVLIASCAPDNPGQKDTNIVAEIDPNTDILTAKKEDCDWEDETPTIIPLDLPVDAASPVTFSWEIDCIPYQYDLRVNPYGTDPGSVEGVYITWFPDWPQPFEDTEHTAADANLEPASYYQWYLRAKDIDDSYVGDVFPIKWSHFYTGPMCASQDLVAPTLVSPADGTIDTGKGWGDLEEVHATVKYPAGECLPTYIEIEFSLAEDFTGSTFNYGQPGYGRKEGEWWFYEDDSTGTQNCTLYYWRARAQSDSGPGLWSETFNFYLDIYGNCYNFPEFKSIQNANCRRDPWAGENYVGVIWEGETAELLGLNEDASWGMFKLKNELECWINMGLVETDPPDAAFYPAFYPVLEHDDPPEDLPAPSSEEDSSGDEAPVGCLAPSGRSGTLTCQIPCPDPNYAARVCP